MRKIATAEQVSTSRNYLNVRVRVQVGSALRWVTVKVPWRLLNERYEDVINAMEGEANRHLKDTWEAPVLPLEKWE